MRDSSEEAEQGGRARDGVSISISSVFILFGAGFSLFKQLDSSCFDRYDLRANAFPHFPHEKGLSDECVCTCALRLLLSANALLQRWQVNGFSPV